MSVQSWGENPTGSWKLEIQSRDGISGKYSYFNLILVKLTKNNYL